jgi:predicted metal-binding membrane protein
MQVRAHTALAFAFGPLGGRLFWLGLYGAILLAWVLLMRMAASPMPGLTAAEYWAALCISAGNVDPLALFAMWGLMSAAMMLPTLVPALRVFGDLGTVRATSGPTMTALCLGYGMVWVVFSALAAALQLGLAKAGAMTGTGQTLSPWVSAGLLLAAGTFQFSPMKEACLAKCRHPLMFSMEHWAPGLRPAFGMGVRLGVFCVGCCWLLMLLGLIGGAMNLLWMGAATLFMVLEKLPEIGRTLTKPLGVALVLGAALPLVSAVSSGG